MIRYRPKPHRIKKCAATMDLFLYSLTSYLTIKEGTERMIQEASNGRTVTQIEYEVYYGDVRSKYCSCYRKEDLVPISSGKINLGKGIVI